MIDLLVDLKVKDLERAHLNMAHCLKIHFFRTAVSKRFRYLSLTCL